uniref:Uncharacterized protein n=1 Tax=Romanomermis culicivorax TaxID=13658 RepID=A0A915I4R1_ROMCU
MRKRPYHYHVGDLGHNNSAHQQQQQQQQSFQPQKNNNLAVGASTFSFSSNSNNSHIGHNFHNSPSFSSSVQSSQCSSSLEKLDELTGSFSSQSSSNQVPNSCGSVKKINIAEMVKCGVSKRSLCQQALSHRVKVVKSNQYLSDRTGALQFLMPDVLSIDGSKPH